MERNFDWDDLIFELGDRNIIPVIGKELLTISGEDGESTPIEQWLVGQLLSHFKDRGDISDSTDFHNEMSFNEFTLGYMNLYTVDKRENLKRIVKKEVTRLLADDAVGIPDVLNKLAAIEHFDLFITTTADTLLDKEETWLLTSTKYRNTSAMSWKKATKSSNEARRGAESSAFRSG